MHRMRIAELMDDPRIDRAAHEHALRSLNRANRLLGVDRRLAAGVNDVAGDTAQVSVLDLGAGGGGFLAYLAARGREAALRIGLDRSLFALDCARNWQRGALHGVVADARQIPLASNSIDVVTCSLFLHHFDPPDAITILREAARVARRGVVIGDLSRSWFAWIVTWIASRLLSRSRLFHVDGPRSVRAAFRRDELAALVQQAELAGASVERSFPFRVVLTWKKVEKQS